MADVVLFEQAVFGPYDANTSGRGSTPLGECADKDISMTDESSNRIFLLYSLKLFDRVECRWDEWVGLLNPKVRRP